MIRFYQSVLALVVWFAVLPTAMHANCAVYAELDRVHFFQQMLQDPNTTISPDILINYLNNQMNTLDDGLVIRAVAAHPASDAPEVFADYMNMTRLLIKATLTVSNRVIPAHYDTPRVRANFNTVGMYLSDLRCAGQIDGGSFQRLVSNHGATPMEEPGTLAGRQLLTPRNVVLVIIGLLIVAVVAWAVRLWGALRRRRLRRYPCSYETKVRYGDAHTETGTVIDISMKGAKLRRMAYLAPRSRVELHIFDHWHPGIVVWSNTHYSGIIFSNSLRKQTVQRMREPARQRTGSLQQNDVSSGSA